jgi:hypothetical protein
MRALTHLFKLIGSLGFWRRRSADGLPPAPSSATAANDSALSLGPPAGERRQSPRRYGDPIQVLIWDGRHGTEPLRGWIVDRSAGGLGISSPEPITNGSFLSIRCALATESIPWIVVVVKNSHSSAGRWMLSCNYVNAPAQEALVLFR